MLWATHCSLHSVAAFSSHAFFFLFLLLVESSQNRFKTPQRGSIPSQLIGQKKRQFRDSSAGWWLGWWAGDKKELELVKFSQKAPWDKARCSRSNRLVTSLQLVVMFHFMMVQFFYGKLLMKQEEIYYLCYKSIYENRYRKDIIKDSTKGEKYCSKGLYSYERK